MAAVREAFFLSRMLFQCASKVSAARIYLARAIVCFPCPFAASLVAKLFFFARDFWLNETLSPHHHQNSSSTTLDSLNSFFYDFSAEPNEPQWRLEKTVPSYKKEKIVFQYNNLSLYNA